MSGYWLHIFYSFYYIAFSVKKIKTIILHHWLSCSPGHSDKKMIALVHLILDKYHYSELLPCLCQRKGVALGKMFTYE